MASAADHAQQLQHAKEALEDGLEALTKQLQTLQTHSSTVAPLLLHVNSAAINLAAVVAHAGNEHSSAEAKLTGEQPDACLLLPLITMPEIARLNPILRM